MNNEQPYHIMLMNKKKEKKPTKEQKMKQTFIISTKTDLRSYL